MNVSYVRRMDEMDIKRKARWLAKLLYLYHMRVMLLPRGGLNSTASFASPQLPCRFHKDRFLFFVHAWLWLWNVVCCTSDEDVVAFISNVGN